MPVRQDTLRAEAAWTCVDGGILSDAWPTALLSPSPPPSALWEDPALGPPAWSVPGVPVPLASYT